MHTFLLFFAWPAGAAWSNVVAMPACGIVAAVFAFLFKDRIGKALKGWHRKHFSHHSQLDDIQARLDVHADALDLHTPGGLAAVMAEVKVTRMAAESAAAETRALVKVVAPTQMRRAAGRSAPKDKGDGK